MIKQFLNDNEIWFKTVTAALLSLMSVLVALSQCSIARDQAKFSEMQTRIAEANSMPQFDVALRQILNNESNKFDDNVVSIINSGGPITEFHATTMVFLSVDATKFRKPSERGARLETVKFETPVSGYFSSQAVTPGSRGVLSTFFGHRNNSQFSALNSKLREINSPEDFVSLKLSYYIILQYIDILNRPHKDYYLVPHVGSGWRISDSEGKRYEESWTIPKKIDFSNLTAEYIMSEVMKRLERI